MTLNRIERVPSGVQGLDAILHGGFARGGIHILQGTPGVGKTTLANQISYHHAVGGGRVLYVTLLSETHARMLLNLGTMSFFEPDRLFNQISYISGFGALQSEGLQGLNTLLRRDIVAHQATVLVLDGLVAAQDSAASDTEFKTFIQELQTQSALQDCTTFLLTTAKGRRVPPEYTMVDGILELGETQRGSRIERALWVRKHRGSDFMPGRHTYRITDAGLVIYPRIEVAYHEMTHADQAWPDKISTGVEGLDAMLLGGLPEATITGIVGPSGVGKTSLGVHFIGQSRPTEPGLIFGFYETPPRLLQKAASLGVDLKSAVDAGTVEVLWQPCGENVQDALAHRLLRAIERRHVRRVLLDGLGGFLEASLEPERIGRFFAVLTNELKARGVSLLYTMETRDIFGSSVEMPVTGISSLVENLIALRYVEHDSRARRLLAILKLRDSGFDPGIRQFVIQDRRGIVVQDEFTGLQRLLSGSAERSGSPTAREGT
ncbi:ATPase domain-containing protein [Plastoroseomonas hellenica]|uniref:ATPase domain-containing protein n=1 Tax=Plastoroseomonas hellenica TaxID=2687306 RepID=UPI001BA910EA|nr:ATPase domain-containing protein [Plastoroseomonas hellenica]MBR0641448.1 AAA family ATPase [Plastoroseomonas hellenica]